MFKVFLCECNEQNTGGVQLFLSGKMLHVLNAQNELQMLLYCVRKLQQYRRHSQSV